jgi:hypothetical protein
MSKAESVRFVRAIRVGTLKTKILSADLGQA